MRNTHSQVFTRLFSFFVFFFNNNPSRHQNVHIGHGLRLFLPVFVQQNGQNLQRRREIERVSSSPSCDPGNANARAISAREIKVSQDLLIQRELFLVDWLGPVQAPSVSKRTAGVGVYGLRGLQRTYLLATSEPGRSCSSIHGYLPPSRSLRVYRCLSCSSG